jgi:hypothetical protein
MCFECLSLFARIGSRGQTFRLLVELVIFIVPWLLCAAILSIIVSTVFHLFSVFLHNPQITFIEVFPNVFYVICIIAVIIASGWKIYQFVS